MELDGAAADKADRLVTGMQVLLGGRWARGPTGSLLFLATTLDITSALIDTVLGTVDSLLGSVVGDVDDAVGPGGLLGGLLGRRLLQPGGGGAAGQPMTTPSSNQLVARDVSTLFIPSKTTLAAMLAPRLPAPGPH